MASIRERKGARGTTFAVLFIDEGRQTSETFRDEKSARKFAGLVDAIGPTGARELLAPENADKATVDDLATEWLEWKRRDMTVEGHRDYKRQYEKWIKPTFGQRIAERVDERDVQMWVDKVLAPQLGAKTVASRHALLHGLYAWASAKTRRHVTHNPCKETVLPKRKKPALRGLSIPELHQLLRAAEKADKTDAADVIALMAGTGLRVGEALGPQVGDIEVTPSGTFLTMSRVYRRGEGVVEGGKTEAAYRRIEVLEPAATMLARRVVGRGADELLFPNPTTGQAWNPTAFRRNGWAPIVEAAGLAERKPTPYWLRHTHVALCHAAGMDAVEIQRRIGHESIQTTINVYGRMINGMSDTSRAGLTALLNPAAAEIVPGEVIGSASPADDPGALVQRSRPVFDVGDDAPEATSPRPR